MQIEDFWNHVWPRSGNGCWLWIAGRDGSGYGRLRLGKETPRAHRVAYELHRGPIQRGMVTDHLCGNRRCVNPNHIEIVTPGENARRGQLKPTHHNGIKTHCPRGHPYNEENTRLVRNPPRRHCRACERERRT